MLSPSLDPYLDECLYDPTPSGDLIKGGSSGKDSNHEKKGTKRKIDLEEESKDSGGEEDGENQGDPEVTFNPNKKPRVTFDFPELPDLDLEVSSLRSVYEAVVPDWDQPGPSGDRSPPQPPPAAAMGPGGDTGPVDNESNKENVPPPMTPPNLLSPPELAVVNSTPPAPADESNEEEGNGDNTPLAEGDGDPLPPSTQELDSPTWPNLSELDDHSDPSSSTNREQEVIYYYTTTSDEDATPSSPVVFRSRRKRSRARRSLSFPPVIPEEYHVVPSWWDPED